MVMSANAREALRLLAAALETHLDAIENRRAPEDAMVDDAYEALADAFERYEDVLDVEYGEGLPMLLDEDQEFAAEQGTVPDSLDAHANEDDDELPDPALMDQLRQLEGEIRKNFAVPKTLREQLDEAVAREDYECAARLRDQIRSRTKRSSR